MAENSGISWTDNTFNPWMGCMKVSPACKSCYAERDFDQRLKKVQWGPSGTRVVTSDANWRKPIKWNKEAKGSGVRKRVFCASLADVFEDWKGPMHDHAGNVICLDAGRPYRMDDARMRLFALIDATPNLDWLLLTKRPENVLQMWPCKGDTDGDGGCGSCHRGICNYRKNVWLGTSVENQEYADKRIPELLKCRGHAPVLFLSCEPMVGPVDLRTVQSESTIYDSLNGECEWKNGKHTGIDERRIDWVIAGGESGPIARPSHPDWFRSLRDQCVDANVPFHFKQWGEWLPFGQEPKPENWHSEEHESTVINACGLLRIGKKSAGRLLDGIEHNGFPATPPEATT